MKKSDDAARLFRKGFNCSQSVFVVFAEDVGLPEETALKIGSGFGGGMGRLQETCGAVTGSFMVLGAKFGNTENGNTDAREKTYTLVRKFYEEFKADHGTVNCRELLQCDLSTDEGRQFFVARDLKTSICEKCVRKAVEITESLLAGQ